MNAGITPLLAVSNLSYAYGERTVLSDLNLEIRRGEVVGLLGPNGSGKSTAFAVIAGLKRAQGGTFLLDGEPVKAGAKALRSHLGVVFQSPGLDNKLTCRHNLELAASLNGISGAERTKRVEEGLDIAALRDRADEAVETLSGGMRRRLDIARALLHHPALLLMDEPTAGLDEAAFRRTWDRLEEARSTRNLAVLVTTHRPEEAERCDRIAVLDGGKVIATDAPRALKEQLLHDVVVLQGPDTSRLLAGLAEFEGKTLHVGNEVRLECERGHELIPRIVDSFQPGELDAVSLRHPSLADVFLKLTGHGLDDEPKSAAGETP